MIGIFKLLTFIHIAPIHSFIHSFIYSFIHSVVCLTTGPHSLQKWFAYWVRSSASPINAQYPLVFLTSSSSFLRLLPRLPFTSIFPSITCFKAVTKHDVTNPLSFRSLCCLLDIPLLLDSIKYFFISHKIGPPDVTFQVFPICFPKCPIFSTSQRYVYYQGS